MNVQPSHVALLVRSVRKTAEYLRQFDFQIGSEEIWEGEGTREIYVEKDKANSLLLMEPTRAGAYQRALDKRGPGLHHLAIDVLNLEEYLISLSKSGWLLHLASLQTIPKSQTAYLARPGFPALIEVQEKSTLSARPLFVERVGCSFDLSLAKLVEPIGLSSLIQRQQDQDFLVLNGQNILLADLLRD